MVETKPGVVSVILVNFRGSADTLEAIRQLELLDWPADRLEIIVVENASGDDSLEILKKGAPQVRLIESSENLGFAGGCNLGVRESSGEYLAFLNNDAKPDKNWIRAAVDRFEKSPSIGGVASKVLDWDGKLVDFIDAGLTWFGMGYKPLTAQPAPKSDKDAPENVLFGTGSAMFVRRDVYDQLGGFDERYFMFFEDVDLGWRLNLLGYHFAYEPKSLAYHKHHASMENFGAYKETYLLERNALYTMYKNMGDEALRNNLAPALLLAARRAVARSERDSTEFDLRKPGGDRDQNIEFSRAAVSTLYGVDQFVEHLADFRGSRAEIQATRQVSDQAIWRLFGETNAPSFGGEHFMRGYSNIIETFPVLDAPDSTHVLIITGDPIGPKMAGPAIRAFHMGEALAVDNAVRLVTLSGVTPVDAPFEIAHVSPGSEREMSKHEEWADVIIFQGLALALFKTLRDSSKIIVADVYDPMHLEQLEQSRELGAAQWDLQVTNATDVLNQQLERGDFFLCASERQRHFYLGQLAALGRVNTLNYQDDPDLTDLISVVPFGLSSTPPAHQEDVMKGVIPGIGKNDKVLLWSGGLYNWFDPKTLIRAVAQLAQTEKSVKLFFQGTKHPHPGVPEMSIVAECRALAAELDVLNTAVFFNDSWVDYTSRQNYLTEADAGVSTHYSHVETTFSFRTRILDYLWAELPMVVTEGDHFADLVRAEGLGVAVPSEDVDALAAALERVLFDEEFRSDAIANVRRVRESYTWEKVLEPLTTFVKDARHADDLIASGMVSVSATGVRQQRQTFAPYGAKRNAQLAWFYLNNGGPKVLVSKINAKLRRR